MWGARIEDWLGLTRTFDGQGYEICDLFINRPDERDVGLLGIIDEGGSIEDIGDVTVTVIGEYYVGSFVGWNEGTVNNSCSTGSVAGEPRIGGLVGYNEKSSVSKSYSVGDVIGNTDFGGLVGLNNEGTVTSSFWDKQTSGTNDGGGAKGETTADMQSIMTFLNASWSICEVSTPQTTDACVWKIVDGQTYPFLSWQSAS